MQHHLTRLGSARLLRCGLVVRCFARCSTTGWRCLRVASSPGRGRAGCGRSARRRSSGVRRGSPSIPARAARARPCATAVSRSRASARSSSPVSWLVPPKETCWWSMVKCRVSAALLGVLGGLVGHEPGDRLGDQPLQGSEADAVRERRHLGVHERCCLLGQQHRRLRDPTGPPRLEVTGVHPRPALGQAVLQLHRRRDQCPSAVGGAADREGELGDAELRHQGAPSPASVRPVSPPGVIQVAASSIDSGGCCSAQVTAATIRSACAACIAAALALACQHAAHHAAESRLLEIGAGWLLS